MERLKTRRDLPGDDASTLASKTKDAGGLIALWTFDEGRGNSIVESLSSRTTRANGPASWGRGRCGSAMEFNARENPTWFDTRFDAVGDPEFRKHFTISAWVRIKAADMPGAYTIADQHDFARSVAEGMRAGFYTAVWPDHRPHFALYVGGRWTGFCPEQQLTPDEWRHLAFVFDSGEAKENLRVYIDGSMEPVTCRTAQEPLGSDIGYARVRDRTPQAWKRQFPRRHGRSGDLESSAERYGDSRHVAPTSPERSRIMARRRPRLCSPAFKQGPGGRSVVAGTTWGYVAGLTGRHAGDVWVSDGIHRLQLDERGNGLAEMPVESTNPKNTIGGAGQ